jgi:hypothetical protein
MPSDIVCDRVILLSKLLEEGGKCLTDDCLAFQKKLSSEAKL